MVATWAERNLHSQKLLCLSDEPGPSLNLPSISGSLSIPPLKCHIFAWKVAYYRVPTKTALQRRGVHILNTSCILCEAADETEDHLFIRYPFSDAVWSRQAHLYKIGELRHGNCTDMWTGFWWGLTSSAFKGYWDVLPTAIIWSIWNERNARIFNNKQKSITVIFNHTNRLIISWTEVTSAKKRNDMARGLHSIQHGSAGERRTRRSTTSVHIWGLRTVACACAT